MGHNGYPGPCEHKYCGLGRHCVVNHETSQGECKCLDHCKPHYKPVCGSDGKLYQNHCELHRASCLRGHRITIMHSEECFYKDDDCRLSDYRRLKTKILDLHDKRYMRSTIHGAHEDNMAARKQLVDMMFKRFDADNNGQIDASELSQVIKQEGLSKDISECTLFDLLKYNDVNDDEHLTKEEFYTAFEPNDNDSPRRPGGQGGRPPVMNPAGGREAMGGSDRCLAAEPGSMGTVTKCGNTATQLYIAVSPDDPGPIDALFNCILAVKLWMAENFLQLSQPSLGHQY
eukprot:superscaffoldBa00000087_g1297